MSTVLLEAGNTFTLASNVALRLEVVKVTNTCVMCREAGRKSGRVHTVVHGTRVLDVRTLHDFDAKRK